MGKICPKCNKRTSDIEQHCSICGTALEDDKDLNCLMGLGRQIADCLQRSFHPHTTVVIEADSIRVEETMTREIIEYAVD